MSALRLYGRYAGASLRAQMQFPGSFLMLASQQAIVTFAEFIAIWALFRRFGQIEGWTFGEVALFYAVINISFSLSESLARGFDVFGPEFVRTGNFDRILLRPRSSILQVLGYEVRLNRLGRVAQAAVVMAIATRLAHVQFDPAAIALMSATIVGGVALFSGIFILQASLSFWAIESLEIANTLTYGGVEAAQYPLNIYGRWFRDFLIFVVPLACVGYFPIVRLLGHRDPLGVPAWLCGASPLFGFAFFAATLVIWRFGQRHYTSTGS